MKNRNIGCLLILVSCILPTIILFDYSMIQPKENIIGIDGLVVSKAIMISYLSFIVAKLGFFILNKEGNK